MSAVIIVENLSKQYRLGQVGTGTLSHDINRWWHKVRGKEDPYSRIGESNDCTQKGDSDYVWALRGINFEVEQGEVLGVIGRNGAGKSTLLKILSRTTAPTTGSVKIKGRVASLLEVGTGFHPELSGRDNIFLNGAILGMTRREIQGKFDEIVDFAGVERYIDTPVKRYSSGMYVRLAFAIAAHLEPEILIVDEVLAVGDAEFQKKCLGKMKDVSTNQGRTVLFVSHNMAAIDSLCSKLLLIEKGSNIYFGNVLEGLNQYFRFNDVLEQIDLPDRQDRSGDGYLRVSSLFLNQRAFTGGKVEIIMEIDSKHEIINPGIAIIISSMDNVVLSTLFSKNCNVHVKLVPGINKVKFIVDSFPFSNGTYKLGVWLSVDGHSASDYLENALKVEVFPGDFYGNGFLSNPKVHGHFCIHSTFINI